MYDVRHPVTKKRYRVSGFPLKSQADEARSVLMNQFRMEKFGLVEAKVTKIGGGILLRPELELEASLMKEEFESFSDLTKRGTATWIIKTVLPLIPEKLAITNLEVSHLEAISNHELKRGLKPSSVNTRMTAFIGVLKRIKQRHKAALGKWHWPRFSVKGYTANDREKKRRMWTDEEFSRIIEVLSHPELIFSDDPRKLTREAPKWRDVRDHLLISSMTGMRKTEVFLIETSKIFLNWGIMQVRTLKRKDRQIVYREIPLSDDLREVISARLSYLSERSNGRVESRLFPRWRDGNTTEWYYLVLRQAAAAAGVVYGQGKFGVVPHGLRHTAATKMLLGGTDVATAAEILGNTVETMLTSYAHTTFSSKLTALESLGKMKLDDSAVVPFKKGVSK